MFTKQHLPLSSAHHSNFRIPDYIPSPIFAWESNLYSKVMDSDRFASSTFGAQNGPAYRCVTTSNLAMDIVPLAVPAYSDPVWRPSNRIPFAPPMSAQHLPWENLGGAAALTHQGIQPQRGYAAAHAASSSAATTAPAGHHDLGSAMDFKYCSTRLLPNGREVITQV